MPELGERLSEMSFRTDSRGAYRGGKRLKDYASKLEKAEALAAADLARRIVPELVRDAMTTHNISAKRVRESSAVRRRGTVVELTGYDRPTGLLQFGARGSRANGVTVTVLKAAGPVVLRHAFIAAGLGGNKQVFQRVAYGKGAFKRKMHKGNYAGQYRTPIAAKYGPSVATILRDPKRQERLVKFSQNTLAAEVRRQLGRL
jgi:hypothetical protein